MVTIIRNGPGGYNSSRSSSTQQQPKFITHLPQIITLLLVAFISFYGGVLLGMNMKAPTSIDNIAYTKSLRGDDADFNARVEAEVTRRLADISAATFSNANSNNNKKDDNNDKQRRFSKTISKIASGASLISKNDFLQNFDYGIPKPPSKREHESDPGKDDVLVLYGTTKAMPDNNLGIEYATDIENGDIPHMSASDATKNCGGLNVIFSESHGDIQQCIAIVGNYESYHIQRWLRINPKGSSRLDNKLPLAPVGRGLQSNGQDKFSPPSDNYALQNQALLETYFARLSDTLEALKPMAKACAGNDNTVIVMVCNTGQSDLLINFICAATARGFGDIVREKVLVFATDKGVLDIGLGLGLRTFYDEEIFKEMPEKEAGRYGDRAFTQMMYAKVVTVQLINRLGYDVLFQVSVKESVFDHDNTYEDKAHT